MILNILGLMIYRSVVDKYGVIHCLKIGFKFLALLPLFYFLLSQNIIECTPYTILTIVCLQSFMIAFIIPGIVSKSIDLYNKNKGLAASASASLRGLCMSITMVAGTYFIGNDVQHVMLAKGCLLILTLILYMTILKTVLNTKS
jgi:hypothetical protein